MKKPPLPNPEANDNRSPGVFTFDNPRVPMNDEDEKAAFRARYPERLRKYQPEIITE